MLVFLPFQAFLAQLHPLRFEPIYQYRLWGGRRLADVLTVPLPGDGPIGEAWLLSDRNDHQSLVTDGPLRGRTIGQLLKQWPEQVLGELAGLDLNATVTSMPDEVRDWIAHASAA